MTARRTFTLAMFSMPLTACGFYLRGSQATAINLHRRIAVDFARAASVQDEFVRRYTQGGGTVVQPDANPELGLQVDEWTSEKVLVASNVQGLATEYQLRMRLVFSVKNAKQETLLYKTMLRTSRDMSFSEANALAKEYEEVQLTRDMQNDLVQQMLYRIAALK